MPTHTQTLTQTLRRQAAQRWREERLTGGGPPRTMGYAYLDSPDHGTMQ